jgi:hypothetical protein
MMTVTANRYYTAFKYAFLLDLLCYNLPAFALHILFMLVTDWPRAIITLRTILSGISEIVRKRRWLATHRRIDRAELHQWYAWSKRQRGDQAVTYLTRFLVARSKNPLSGPQDGPPR